MGGAAPSSPGWECGARHCQRHDPNQVLLCAAPASGADDAQLGVAAVEKRMVHEVSTEKDEKC